MADESLTIEQCPSCSYSHRYKLRVERSIVVKLAHRFELTLDVELPRRVKLTRLFTCPRTDKEFQATFALTDTSVARITSVAVEGIADDADEKR